MIKIRRPSEDKIDTTSAPPPETGVRGETLVSEILTVYEAKPYLMTPGFVELRPEWYKDEQVLVEGSRTGAGAAVGWKDIGPDLR